jgi:hypothetical protein
MLPVRATALAVLLVGCAQTSVRGQSIQNGDFEELIDCPSSFGPDLSIQLTMASWLTVQGTPDGLHASCPAIDPGLVPGVAPVVYGEGYGGVWGPEEVFGQAMDPPLSNERTYCLTFSGIAVHPMGGTLPAGDPCLRLCVYGSTAEPPFPDPWSIPVPVETMPGTVLLACTEPLSTLEWSDRSVSFSPADELPHLFLTSAQDPDCSGIHPYLCLDSMRLVECSAAAINGPERAQATLYPTANGIEIQMQDPRPVTLSLHDLQGSVVSNSTFMGYRTTWNPPRSAADVYLITLRQATGRVIARQPVFLDPR